MAYRTIIEYQDTPNILEIWNDGVHGAFGCAMDALRGPSNGSTRLKHKPVSKIIIEPNQEMPARRHDDGS